MTRPDVRRRHTTTAVALIAVDWLNWAMDNPEAWVGAGHPGGHCRCDGTDRCTLTDLRAYAARIAQPEGP